MLTVIHTAADTNLAERIKADLQKAGYSLHEMVSERREDMLIAPQRRTATRLSRRHSSRRSMQGSTSSR
jgi:hypothetical protein